MSRRIFILPIALLTLFSFTACAQTNTEDRQGVQTQQYDANENRVAIPNVNNRGRYEEDGYLGLTNANPQLYLGRNNLPTYQDDAVRITSAVRQMQGVRNAYTVVSAGHAIVYYQASPRLAEQDRLELGENIRQQIQFMMPRYQVLVRQRDNFRDVPDGQDLRGAAVR